MDFNYLLEISNGHGTVTERSRNGHQKGSKPQKAKNRQTAINVTIGDKE